ncbi:helix-turn-helix domain-containing protein [Cryptosporangium japonicum]|uniref:Helix-turn-helix domain-containing protein n=1 Tax=Cryptosporangium japonicum TaxID=80872 RepID=A0ABP3E6H4_9ACTN
MTTTSAADRRAERARVYNANLADCPGHDLLGRLSDKWLTLVVAALADGPRRHGELASIVAGATQKMLTQTLRTLERDGLVTRTVVSGLPVKVVYALTPLGESLLPLQRAIKDWAETHIEEVRTARAGYDAGPSR